ncbi:MAG: sulfite exporter TauE/SafE family protein [Betaproteobacteria bacterium]|nr:sulfite exporter TauE/SafE family protein [Betaproteobacteria bacterium]
MADWLFAVHVAIGALGGLCAGLFGIGGGVVFGPLLLLLAVERGIPVDSAVAGAVATSSAIVILTAVPSALMHSVQGSVDWRLLRVLAPAAVVGAALGAWLVVRVDPRIPELLMLALLIIGIRALWKRPAAAGVAAVRPQPAMLVTGGSGAGCMGALTGTGGGLITMPMLVRAEVTLPQAIGTSAVVTMLIAGTASGVFAGEAVNLAALISVSCGAIAFAVLGARLATKLAGGIIRWLCCALMIGISLRLGYWLVASLLA